MQIEHWTSVNSPPEIIFRIYEDVSSWSTWDPDTKSATIEGPFQAGSSGKLTPAKGNTVPMMLTEVVKNKSFTVESKIPLFRMMFEHELQAKDETTDVIHRVIFSGLLSFVLSPIIAKQLNAGLPVTLNNLKWLAESQYAA